MKRPAAQEPARRQRSNSEGSLSPPRDAQDDGVRRTGSETDALEAAAAVGDSLRDRGEQLEHAERSSAALQEGASDYREFARRERQRAEQARRRWF